MKIFIGADHNGYDLKQQLIEFLGQQGHEVIDTGDTERDSQDDFPQFAGRLVTTMLASYEKDPRGILICGSGQGMAMAANRFKGIRASLVWDEFEAKAARNDDDSNVLVLPAREMTDFNKAKDLVTTWLNTPFGAAQRYIRRIRQLDELG